MSDKSKIIPIASDHAAFNIKQHLVKKLTNAGYQVKDFGTYSEDRVDYPDFIHKVASAVNNGTYVRGIILCGSGNGAQITANKYKGVRAGLAWNNEQAELIRQHNDANIISLPGRFVTEEGAWEMTQIFLNTDFAGGRHTDRVKKISNTID